MEKTNVGKGSLQDVSHADPPPLPPPPPSTPPSPPAQPWLSSLLAETQFLHLLNGSKQPAQQSGKHQVKRRKPFGNHDTGLFKSLVLPGSPSRDLGQALPSQASIPMCNMGIATVSSYSVSALRLQEVMLLVSPKINA